MKVSTAYFVIYNSLHFLKRKMSFFTAVMFLSFLLRPALSNTVVVCSNVILDIILRRPRSQCIQEKTFLQRPTKTLI